MTPRRIRAKKVEGFGLALLSHPAIGNKPKGLRPLMGELLPTLL